MNRVAMAIMGTLIILFGYKIMNKPILSNLYGDYAYDFTGFNKPFGILVILVGMAFIYFSITKGRKS